MIYPKQSEHSRKAFFPVGFEKGLKIFDKPLASGTHSELGLRCPIS